MEKKRRRGGEYLLNFLIEKIIQSFITSYHVTLDSSFMLPKIQKIVFTFITHKFGNQSIPLLIALSRQIQSVSKATHPPFLIPNFLIRQLSSWSSRRR